MSTMRYSNQIAAKKNSFMIFLVGKWIVSAKHSMYLPIYDF